MKVKTVVRAIVGLGALGVAMSVVPVKESKPVKLSKSEMASITAAGQPQSGQPGYTEGQPGPAPGHTGTNGPHNNNPH